MGAANNDDEGDNEGDDQIEFLEGVQVYACNICDEWFDIEDKIKKYIAVNHKDILLEISKKKLMRKKMTTAVKNQS